MNNAFEKTVREMRSGVSADELSEHLATLVEAVRRTGKGGVLTYKLKVKPASHGDVKVVMLNDEITLKLPQSERPSSVFFTTDENGLQRSDPNQQEMELRTVPKPDAVEVRKVG